MLIERFLIFHQRLTKLAGELEGVRILRVFRHSSGAWIDTSLLKPVNDALAGELGKASKRKVSIRKKRPTEVLCSVPSLKVVVLAKLRSGATNSDHRQLAGQLKTCARDAQHEFDATHKPLTGLPNEIGFQSALQAVIADYVKSRPKEIASNVGSPATSKSSVTLLTVDIDHFKQVNDSYGHIYGDIVLRALAMRFRRVADSLRNERPELSIEVAHTGGEEFQVLASGSFLGSEIADFAEAFRTEVANAPLPDKQELDVLEVDGILGGVRLPRAAERNVTVSIGIASAADVEEKSDVGRFAIELRRRADLALARAKADGRNTACDFAEVIKSHGRVLEHHETGIVAIDLGANVGVAPGQEFIVFHPDFSGTVPYHVSDGRTQRRLGFYPRVPSGRVLVFQVQPDVSFCRVTQQNERKQFAPRSALEAVPIGSIGHIIGDAQFTFGVKESKLPSADEILRIASQFAADSRDFVIAVFSLTNWKDVQLKHGSWGVNDALGKLYNSMRNDWPQAAIIAQPQQVDLALISGVSKDTDPLKLAEKTVESGGGALPSASFRAGIFRSDSSEARSGAWNVPPQRALDAAMYALTEASLRNVKASQFSLGTVNSILVDAYGRDLYPAVLRDYETFKSFGVERAFNESFAGASLYMMGKFDRALSHFDAAAKLQPSEGSNWMRRFQALCLLGRNVEAEKDFDKAVSLDPKYVRGMNEAFLEGIVRVLMANKKAGTTSKSVQDIMVWVEHAIEVNKKSKSKTMDERERRLAVYRGQLLALK